MDVGRAGESAQAITADYLDLSEHIRRLELTKSGPEQIKKRYGSLRSIPVGTKFVTQRGNSLVRVSSREVLLANKVRLEVKDAATPSSAPGAPSLGADNSDAGSAVGSAVSTTWYELEDSHSRLVLNVVKQTAQTLVGMLLDESRQAGGAFVEVIKLMPEGAAAKAGVQVGDLVLKIDDRRVLAETTAAAMMQQPGVHVFEIARRKPKPPKPSKPSLGFMNFGRDRSAYACPEDDAGTMISMASSTASSALK